MENDSAALVAAFLRAVEVRDTHGALDDVNRSLVESFDRLTRSAASADLASQNRMLMDLAAELTPSRSGWAFASIANTCGRVVEEGGDPTLAVGPIVDRLTDLLGQVPSLVRAMQERMGIEHPSHIADADWPGLAQAYPQDAWVVAEWHHLRLVACAAMAMLCRDISARQQARQRPLLLENAEAARGDNAFAYYIAEVLAAVDDERLLVLDMTRRRAFRVRLTAVRNNFHLFTLLQGALAEHPSGRDLPHQLRRLAVAIARSERMVADISADEWAELDPDGVGSIADTAWWTYYTNDGLRPDGSYRTLAESRGAPPWVWGEMKPTAIPPVDGERIVLLGPLECPRSWDVAFFSPLHSALRSSVTIESTLDEAAFAIWQAKLLQRG